MEVTDNLTCSEISSQLDKLQDSELVAGAGRSFIASLTSTVQCPQDATWNAAVSAVAERFEISTGNAAFYIIAWLLTFFGDNRPDLSEIPIYAGVSADVCTADAPKLSSAGIKKICSSSPTLNDIFVAFQSPDSFVPEKSRGTDKPIDKNDNIHWWAWIVIALEIIANIILLIFILRSTLKSDFF